MRVGEGDNEEIYVLNGGSLINSREVKSNRSRRGSSNRNNFLSRKRTCLRVRYWEESPRHPHVVRVHVSVLLLNVLESVTLRLRHVPYMCWERRSSYFDPDRLSFSSPPHQSPFLIVFLH